LSLLKISNPQSIEGRIKSVLDEASNLLLQDRERLFKEIEKLISVAEGSEDQIKNSLKVIKETLKV